MSDKPGREPILIKKYPNRRYYDATRSRHVTLQEVYEMVCSGRDIVVTDSRNNEDLTNLVLLQMILERDQPKLDLFPSSILHMMIRSNHQVLRATFERFFGPFMSIVADSQKQFDAYLRQAIHGSAIAPFQWAANMMQNFAPGGPRAPASPIDAEEHVASAEEEGDVAEALDDLRGQIEMLTRRVDDLRLKRDAATPPGPRAAPPTRRKPASPDDKRK